MRKGKRIAREKQSLSLSTRQRVLLCKYHFAILPVYSPPYNSSYYTDPTLESNNVPCGNRSRTKSVFPTIVARSLGIIYSGTRQNGLQLIFFQSTIAFMIAIILSHNQFYWYLQCAFMSIGVQIYRINYTEIAVFSLIHPFRHPLPMIVYSVSFPRRKY